MAEKEAEERKGDFGTEGELTERGFGDVVLLHPVFTQTPCRWGWVCTRKSGSRPISLVKHRSLR